MVYINCTKKTKMCRIKKYFPILFSSTNAFFSLFLFYTKRSCQKYFFTIKILADAWIAPFSKLDINDLKHYLSDIFPHHRTTYYLKTSNYRQSVLPNWHQLWQKQPSHLSATMPMTFRPKSAHVVRLFRSSPWFYEEHPPSELLS